jgi:hypothetical protein
LLHSLVMSPPLTSRLVCVRESPEPCVDIEA